MAGHTPGPWVAENAGLGWMVLRKSDHDRVRGDRRREEVFAPLFTQEDLGLKAAEAEANARLVAAAPDLLVALERMLEAEGKVDDEYYALIGDAERVARMAVAKATGRRLS